MKSKIKSKKFALFAALLAVISCTLIGIKAICKRCLGC